MNQLDYDFTEDPCLLAKFRSIYEREFRLSHADPGYRGGDDAPCRQTRVCMVRDGSRCVGGASLTIRTPGRPDMLPSEAIGLKLTEHFPEIVGRDARYGQIRQMCLLPEYRVGRVPHDLLSRLHREVAAAALQKVFGTALPIHARIYKIGCISMGLERVSTHAEIAVPTDPVCGHAAFRADRRKRGASGTAGSSACHARRTGAALTLSATSPGRHPTG